MKTWPRLIAVIGILLHSVLIGSNSLAAQPQAERLTPTLVEEAYIWGLPIVAMYRYTVAMGSNVDSINQVFHNRRLFEPGVLPGGANRDTLYSFGWFDLNDEPYVVSIPDFQDRYFVWQMTDMYGHNFANVGSHLLEGPVEKYRGGYTFLLAGPDWQGQPPDGVELIRAPAPLINILYRIAVTDETDMLDGNRLQDATLTLPLSEWNKGRRETGRNMPSKPIPAFRGVIAFGAGTTGKNQRNPEFFSVLQDALRLNPPYAWWDRKFVDTHLAALGIAADSSFDFNQFDESTQKMILDSQERAFDRVMELSDGGFGPMINGWQFGPEFHGDWRDHFLQRAYGIYIGGMWPVPANSTYALVHVDANDELMVGNNLYALEFGPGQLPPATSFWSVTLYETGTFDLYPNKEKVYVVGSLHDSTRYAEDGSLSIVFSHERPAGQEDANWIPAPMGKFWLAVRFYAPTDSVMLRDYILPPVRRLQ